VNLWVTGSGCYDLGPAHLVLRSVTQVNVSHSEVGQPGFSVVLTPEEGAALRTLATRSPARLFALVLLGRIQSTPTGSLLNIGTELTVGNSNTRTLHQVAAIYRAPVVQEQPAPCPTVCFSTN
jgi:hypothetical protein